MYDTDTGHKMCMTTAVACSPINYANMNSTVPRFKAPKREKQHNDGGYYRPNARLLERLYEHFRKTAVNRSGWRSSLYMQGAPAFPVFW